MHQKRDGQGRFVVGNPGGPGRPKRQTEAGYLAVLMEECSLDKWRAVVKRAVEDATDGNEKARQWLASYLVGAPTAEAPAPTKVVIESMLGTDPALEAATERLAAPDISRRKYPTLAVENDFDDAVRFEAREAIIAAEQRQQADVS